MPQKHEHWTGKAITDTEEDIRAGRVSRPFKNIEDLMPSLDIVDDRNEQFKEELKHCPKLGITAEQVLAFKNEGRR